MTSGEPVRVAIIKGDGIGVDVANAALAAVDAARSAVGGFTIDYREIAGGAGYFRETGHDLEPGGEETAGEADAMFVGAIGLPSVRKSDGTEIAPHLRLRDRYGLYAGVRPVRAYPNAPRRLADPRAGEIDLVILRESTEGLFYTAAVHGRSEIVDDFEARDIMRITRPTTEKLHRFGFQLAERRRRRGARGLITCVDKANVFVTMAFFRQIFDEIATEFPDVETGYNYIDAQALDLVRQPWEFDVLVTENIFGDILSDLAAALVGGMGMAACAEIGDTTGLFQPAHGSAPDIAGQDKANPLAAILSAGMMLEYLEGKADNPSLGVAGRLIDDAVYRGFAEKRIRPMEFGGDMGTIAVAREVVALVGEARTREVATASA
ncbi:isocitrate/isopropylmalate dehydrogenase family protein [Bauldia sp.]|uniref:isocitrate/isopropylmalate dehydrogenase family protein n=1 Tax=Bauldia sp. TaxID=2575872 RepID=UPI003BA89A67